MFKRLKHSLSNSKRGPSKSVFFIHIAKTGGVTVETLLKKDWPPEKVSPFYIEQDYLESGENLRRYTLYYGHAPYYVRSILPEPCYTFTVLREPVARTVSAYEHVMRDHLHPLHKKAKLEAPTIIEFMNHPRLSLSLVNPQTKFLGLQADFPSLLEKVRSKQISSNEAIRITWDWHLQQCNDKILECAKSRLESMSRFGITENLQQCINLVQDDLGLPIDSDIPILNSNPCYESLSSRYGVEVIRAIQRMNSFDIELYKYAKHKLHIMNAKKMQST